MNKAVDTRPPMPMPVAGSPGSGPCGAGYSELRQAVTASLARWWPLIAGLKALVEQDPSLYPAGPGDVFDEAWQHEHSTPLGRSRCAASMSSCSCSTAS